jgi:hypothetical protein
MLASSIAPWIRCAGRPLAGPQQPRAAAVSDRPGRSSPGSSPAPTVLPTRWHRLRRSYVWSSQMSSPQ